MYCLHIELCFHGIPEDRTIKATCWKILLGYLPLKTAEWPSHLQRQRNLYEFYINLLFQNPDSYDNGMGPNNNHLSHHSQQHSTSGAPRGGSRRGPSRRSRNIRANTSADHVAYSTPHSPVGRKSKVNGVSEESYDTMSVPKARTIEPKILKNAYFQDDDEDERPQTATRNSKGQRRGPSLFDDSDDEHRPKPGLFDSDGEDEEALNAANTDKGIANEIQVIEVEEAENEKKGDDEEEEDRDKTDKTPSLNALTPAEPQTEQQQNDNVHFSDLEETPTPNDVVVESNNSNDTNPQHQNQQNHQNGDDSHRGSHHDSTSKALKSTPPAVSHESTPSEQHGKDKELEVGSRDSIQVTQRSENSTSPSFKDIHHNMSSHHRQTRSHSDELVYITPSESKNSSSFKESQYNPLLKDLSFDQRGDDDPLQLIPVKRSKSKKSVESLTDSNTSPATTPVGVADENSNKNGVSFPDTTVHGTMTSTSPVSIAETEEMEDIDPIPPHLESHPLTAPTTIAPSAPSSPSSKSTKTNTVHSTKRRRKMRSKSSESPGSRSVSPHPPSPKMRAPSPPCSPPKQSINNVSNQSMKLEPIKAIHSKTDSTILLNGQPITSTKMSSTSSSSTSSQIGYSTRDPSRDPPRDSSQSTKSNTNSTNTKQSGLKPLPLHSVARHNTATPDPLANTPNNPWKTYFDDWEIWNRIKKDIHRTHQTYAFFRSNHMICEDSASKSYRFPFDIMSSPVPQTPSSTMPGLHNHGKPAFSFAATEPMYEDEEEE